MMINKDTKEWAPVPALPRCRPTHQGRHRHHRRGSRAKILQLHDGHGPPEELQAFPGTQGLTLGALFKKFDKTWALTKRSTVKYGRTSPDRTYEDAMKRRQTDP